MKRAVLLLSLLLFGLKGNAQESPFGNDLSYYIENPAVFEENQEEGHSYYVPEKRVSLNGQWKFFLSETTENLPVGFFKPSFNDKKWSTIAVPSNWEMEGFGDKLFRNISLSFPPDPPHVPKEYNPVGLYRRSFNIPSDWKGQQIFLRFEKIASASFVWVNGQKVGYNEGAHEPAEYNITTYIQQGKNTITVCAIKYSDGYYLEDQDYWRLAGIFDDVWVYPTPSVRLFDWQFITDFDDNYTDCTLEINAIVKEYDKTSLSPYTVKTTLYNKANKEICTFSGNTIRQDKPGMKTISLKHKVHNPLKWTSETPDLYDITLELYDKNGKVIDRIHTHIGFKKTEIKGGVFYLNGKPLKVNAQNSHMQHPVKGHVVDEETIRKDFELLKQFNFNAVRTSHYPPTNKYLKLANEYGIYIIDEAGTEAHATEWLSAAPDYAEMYKERCRRMVLRDRNYPCILFWSAGNESGEGENIAKIIGEGKKLDPTRYWMYGGNAFSHPAEDIIGPRYPTPIELETQVGLQPGKDNRPSFMDEYLSVAGNGGGGLDDYWNVIYAYPRLMGGAIWDYVSTGVTEPVRALTDISPHHTPAHLMGNATLVKEGTNTVLDLNGHDQWVEVYRQDNVEIKGNQLMLTFRVYPRKLSSSSGSYITKGNYQFGVHQKGKETLEFYIYTDKKYSVNADLPENWKYHWHDVKAIYNGEKMILYIDNEEKASKKVSGNIRNFPFPVNIGRNAEIHGQETSVYICDARMDNVCISTEITDEPYPENAILWLDFEAEQQNGNFYSYGIGARTYGSIWPDRKPQPEMWQMKKTVQPLTFRMVDIEKGLAEVWNRNHFLEASYYTTYWQLESDDEILQQGKLSINTPPLAKEIIQIPYNKPDIEPGKEYRITVSVTLKNDELWASTGYEVAWDQFDLPWKQVEEYMYTGDAPGYFEKGNLLMVEGKDFCYTFDKTSGLLVSILSGGKEMLCEPLRLNLWRAPLANELDDWNSGSARSGNWKEGYGRSISTEMYSAGLNQLFHQPLSFDVFLKEKTIHIHIRDIYLMGEGEKEKKDLYIEGYRCNGFRNEYEFMINGSGRMDIRHIIKPEGKMPLWFPRIGLTMVLDKSLQQIKWNGRGPQENYPDRKTGYKRGIYQSSLQDMYEPYLIPQDHGLRTDNRWVCLNDSDGNGLKFSMNEYFNFNAYPFSTKDLTKAMYTYQLREQEGITLNLDYLTSGVGCTARGIFASYRVMPQAYERVITINPLSGKKK